MNKDRITPSEMARRSHQAQILKYGGKDKWKLEMKRRSLLGVEKRRAVENSLSIKNKESKI